MDASLRALIERFRAAQDRSVAFVVEVLGPTLGVRLPRSPLDWLDVCRESALHHVRKVNGVEVYPHGFGLELTFPELSIDFDWGDCGEGDGFDVWRLYNFARFNPSDAPAPTHATVEAWVEAAAAAGELTRDQLLYYSPQHRATPRPTDSASP